MNNPASLRSEVTRLDWINCPVCRGIADQFAVERVSSLSGIRSLRVAVVNNFPVAFVCFFAYVFVPTLFRAFC